jgi:hypothetical protein
VQAPPLGALSSVQFGTVAISFPVVSHAKPLAVPVQALPFHVWPASQRVVNIFTLPSGLRPA